ncbi:MFS transporter [Propionibacterium freudenreichii]|uniref:MFS transporter n=1 Tax=Propionibacterium freudenreichii TaxID=1744 RepID=UPI000BC328FB|nr:MFS transporter [Propionibacterium freudenreichii]MDK9294640.1 MFS transporter [Propionibacterium freudenreichii]MDK9359969.1 MFS transporter [Propionibacterium freudenreichii]MDK9639133.1 MFS transporter [Propionibacterium freudenreichii]MDK9659856.1 MFS transporter [Propionibacterium freudenreichii]WGU90926.1 MFS transporter [Propionibacterium freudenreichii]
MRAERGIAATGDDLTAGERASRALERPAADSHRDVPGGSPTAPPWKALWVLAAGLAIIVLDGTIVSVAMPTIIDSIGISLTDAQWVTSLYNIVLAALLLPLGKLGDEKGRKALFLIGIVVFMAGSGLAALSGAAAPLLASRTVQAIGAAMIMPSTLSIVSASFRGRDRAAAFGVWGAVMSGAAALGPLLGGIFTETIGWRWIFLVNIPVGIVIVALGLKFVPHTGGASALPGASDPTGASRRRGRGPLSFLDVPGTVLASLGAALFVFGLIEGNTYGWWSPTAPFSVAGIEWPTGWAVSVTPVALFVGAALIVAFVVVERLRGARHKAVTLDMRLFSIPSFSWGNLTAGAVSAGEFALVFVLPLYLVNAVGLSTIRAGLVLMAMALGAMVSGALARKLAAALGAARVVQLGLLLEIIGVAISVTIMKPSMSPLWFAGTLIIYGVGLGLASAQLTSLVLGRVPVAQSGEGSATQSTVRQLGSALGAAISGTALSVALGRIVPGLLSAIPGMPAAAVSGLVDSLRGSAGGSIATVAAQGGHGQLGELGPRVAEVMAQGFSRAAQWSMGIAAAMLVLGLIGSLMVRRAAQRG